MSTLEWFTEMWADPARRNKFLLWLAIGLAVVLYLNRNRLKSLLPKTA